MGPSGRRGRFARRPSGLPSRAAFAGQGAELDPGSPAEHCRMQVHEHRANLRKLDLESLPVGTLEEPLQRVESRRCGLQRHAEDVALPLKLHVGAVDDVHRVELHALAPEHLASLAGLLGEGLVDGSDVECGKGRVDGAHVVVAQIRDHAPQRIGNPGSRGDDDPGDAQLVGEVRRVQRSGAAEREQREVARVVTARQRNHPQRPRHAVVGDAQHRGRGFLRIESERCTDLLVESRCDRIERDRILHRQQRLRVEPSEQKVGVGDGDPLAAAPEADGTG